MFESDEHAALDRNHLREDANLILIPLTIVLGMTVATSLLVYVIRSVGGL